MTVSKTKKNTVTQGASQHQQTDNPSRHQRTETERKARERERNIYVYAYTCICMRASLHTHIQFMDGIGLFQKVLLGTCHLNCTSETPNPEPCGPVRSPFH